MRHVESISRICIRLTHLCVSTVTDYGEENPLLMDYYGFQPALYQLKFKSRGDSSLSRRVLDLFKKVCSMAMMKPRRLCF